MKRYVSSEILLRLLILLSLGAILNLWFFSYFRQATEHISLFEKGVNYYTESKSISEILSELSPTVKILIPLMKFNAYAENSTVNGTATSTNLNISVSGKYTIVPSGSTKLIYESFYLNHGFVFERSISSVDDDNQGLNENLSGGLKVFFNPTITTWFLILVIIMIPVAYASIVVFSACVKFVLTGHPLHEVLDELNRNK